MKDRITVKELKLMLSKLEPQHDDLEVQVWLPGSYIRLGSVFFNRNRNKILIEGNIEPGSALEYPR